jgi:hypothetical protein
MSTVAAEARPRYGFPGSGKGQRRRAWEGGGHGGGREEEERRLLHRGGGEGRGADRYLLGWVAVGLVDR